jgi:hypothetical protein
MAVIVSVKFHLKRSNGFQNRNFIFRSLQIQVVSMVMAAILEVVYDAKTVADDG